MTEDRRSLVFKVLTLLIFLGGCSSTTKTANTTAATVPAVTTVTKLTTATPTPATTFEPTTSVTPMTLAPVTTKAPSTTKPKTTPTTYPQLQLTGTQEEQLTQVVAATAKVAAVMGFGPWSKQLYHLKQSVASYGITIEENPATNAYKISMNGQSSCYIWTYKDTVSNDKHLQPHSC